MGFSACGLARVEAAESEMAHYDAWIAKGYQAGMHYMANHRPLRRDPKGLLEGAKSIISVALNYYPAHPLPKEAPQVAYYAYGKDYHVVVKERLRQLGERLGLSDEMRCFTDSAHSLQLKFACSVDIYLSVRCRLFQPMWGTFNPLSVILRLGQRIQTLS